MRLKLFALVVATVLGGTVGASASEPVITNPGWEKPPSALDLAPYYPPRARLENVEGKATIECKVAIDGSLSDCRVVSEEPAGYGFGEATVQAARTFRMRPRTENGKPVGGAEVRIPLTWKLGAPVVPDIAAVDADAAAACFATYFVAIETNLAREDDLPAIQLFQWGALATAKASLSTYDPREIEAKMRAGIIPARRRASANPTLFRAEVDDCDRAMRALYKVPSEPQSGR